ncbi:uncharacterized protein KRP23_11698 [Phytophthora ramorum]|uniref:uncharacterized protein n=1 Tax=Phytophthora ramorum TaxID=164328 RepID=UPI0030ABA91C|nr:hypothetical protein KRP23_11698 [Phytophthora ramorum]
MPVMLVPVVVAVNEAVVVAEDVTVAEDAELDVKVGAEVAEKEGLLRPRRASDEREGGEYDATRCDIQKPAALALAASDSDESLLLDSADDDVVLVGGPYIMDYPPFDR